jgi:hypothetical protein
MTPTLLRHVAPACLALGLVCAGASAHAQAAPETEGEPIVVTGTRIQSAISYNWEGGTFGWSYDYNWTQPMYDWDAYDSWVEPSESPECQAAKAELDKQIAAAKASGKAFVLGAENHYDDDTNAPTNGEHLPGIIDSTFPPGQEPGSCVAFETASYEQLPDAYRSVALYAQLRGLGVHYMDQASGYEDRDAIYGDSAFDSAYVLNTRDSLMANYLFSVSSVCTTTLAIVGQHHTGEAYGRATLSQQLGDAAITIDTTKVESACQ